MRGIFIEVVYSIVFMKELEYRYFYIEDFSLEISLFLGLGFLNSKFGVCYVSDFCRFFLVVGSIEECLFLFLFVIVF